jgi:FtsP/CotA-like multicopper oxidase with cupredoxin domain
VTLNGQLAPTIDIRPGEAQLWRIANIGADLFLELDLGGVRAFTVATDGHPLERPAPCGRVLLGPGQRVELVVVGPPPGRYPFRSVPLVLEEGKPPLPEHLLGTVVSAGPPGDADAVARRIEAARAPPSPALVALRDAPVTARRAFVFTRSMDRMRFYINGKLFGEAASRSGPSATRTTSSTTSTSTRPPSWSRSRAGSPSRRIVCWTRSPSLHRSGACRGRSGSRSPSPIR